MASHIARFFLDSNRNGCIGDKERAPEILQKVVDLCGYCMGVQCFTVERLGKNGRDERMESLTELEEFIGTLDLAPEEERSIARILEKLREEAAAS